MSSTPDSATWYWMSFGRRTLGYALVLIWSTLAFQDGGGHVTLWLPYGYFYPSRMRRSKQARSRKAGWARKAPF